MAEAVVGLGQPVQPSYLTMSGRAGESPYAIWESADFLPAIAIKSVFQVAVLRFAGVALTCCPSLYKIYETIQ